LLPDSASLSVQEQLGATNTILYPFSGAIGFYNPWWVFWTALLNTQSLGETDVLAFIDGVNVPSVLRDLREDSSDHILIGPCYISWAFGWGDVEADGSLLGGDHSYYIASEGQIGVEEMTEVMGSAWTLQL
jgi:hypothetical protein